MSDGHAEGNGPASVGPAALIVGPGDRFLSGKGAPVKLTIRDQASGMLVQTVIPDGWCPR